MVAGPPVEVQARVVERTSKVKLVTSGEPAENRRKGGGGGGGGACVGKVGGSYSRVSYFNYSKTLVFMGMSFPINPRPHVLILLITE